MQNEIWKDVSGYEGSYQVSNLGRVKSLARVINRTDSKLPLKECIMRLYTNKRGYQVATLTKNSIQKTHKVHRLVANHFIPNPKNKPQVNHMNGIKTDNNVHNLEWCTSSENLIHAYKLGLKSAKGINNGMYGKLGKDNPSSKCVYQYDLNMKLIKSYDSIRSAERDIGVSNQNISKVCKGKRPLAGGFIWSYKKFKGDE